MPSFGVSLALQKPTSPLSFSATYFFGQANTTYVDRQITFSQMNYSANTVGFGRILGRPPTESNVTFLAGARLRFYAFSGAGRSPGGIRQQL